MADRTFLRRAADVCAESFLLRRGRTLWADNQKNVDQPLSKTDKLLCGGYVILKDYAAGAFPPRFDDRAIAYAREAEYAASLPGVDFAAAQENHARKPFWTPASSTKYLDDLNRLYEILIAHGVGPGQRLLELGCGAGWMAELLAVAGYSVVGVTISLHDLELAQRKAAAHAVKALRSELAFREGAMESVAELPGLRGAFDATYVYEALHHAFDWQATLHSARATLKPRGLLLLANEPNRLHTAISYRLAKLTKTHEIGFSKRALLRALHDAGFDEIEVLQPRWDDWLTDFWIAARRTG